MNESKAQERIHEAVRDSLSWLDRLPSQETEILEQTKKEAEPLITVYNGTEETRIEPAHMPVVTGICNTRDKIAKSINCEVSEITEKIIDAMENPQKVTKFTDFSEYDNLEIDLGKIPILTHYKRDGGAYITAGVVFARDPVTGIQNASIHRMMVLDDKRLVIRIVPRNLYTYFQNAQKAGEDLQIAIAIGMDPAILLASTTSIPIDYNEMEVANAFKDGELELIKCGDLEVPQADIILEGKISVTETVAEGPFVDLTDTYDIIRDQPIINLEKMHIKKDNPCYHAIVPAGFEHKLLQGLPQEPRIFKAVKNAVPTVENVVLTEGGCCWLHAVVSINKQTEGDGKARQQDPERRDRLYAYLRKQQERIQESVGDRKRQKSLQRKRKENIYDQSAGHQQEPGIDHTEKEQIRLYRKNDKTRIYSCDHSWRKGCQSGKRY